MKSSAGSGGVPVCSCCGEPAVIYLPASQRHLCGRHLICDVELRVASTIKNESQISLGDRVAVAISGGKDSTALLVILSRLLLSFPGSEIVAITVDEGIVGYRADTLRAAEALTQQLGINHHIVSFRDQIGDDLDTLLTGREKEACTICGILRKKALADAARDAGATVIATGHNLDDEAQSVLMNTLRGDLPRLIRDTGPGSSSLFLPRIKPLSAITEKEIAAYLFVKGLFSVLPECPYTKYALRAEVRTMLNRLEQLHPGTMLHLVYSKKRIEHYCEGMAVMEPLRRCQECGDPSSGEICQVCRLKHSLGK